MCFCHPYFCFKIYRHIIFLATDKSALLCFMCFWVLIHASVQHFIVWKSFQMELWNLMIQKLFIFKKKCEFWWYQSAGRLISFFVYNQIFIKDISSGKCSLQSLIKSKGLIINQFCCLRQGGREGWKHHCQNLKFHFTWKACLRVASS